MPVNGWLQDCRNDEYKTYKPAITWGTISVLTKGRFHSFGINPVIAAIDITCKPGT